MGGMPLRGRVAALLVVAAGALALVLTAVPAPAAAAATTLTVIGGEVSVTRGTATLPGGTGDVVRAGDTVVTGASGHAVLTFADGSTTALSPRTTLVVEEAALRGSSVTVRLFQTVGGTWSSVARLLAPGSRFGVRTPAATAAVRGTAFEVSVAADGTTLVRTAEGTVTVENERGSVEVPEGTETRTRPGAPPPPPAPAPPSTRRTIEVGAASVLVVDTAGRGCGVHEGRTVEQIPGCVVRDGAIELQDVERIGEIRVETGAAADREAERVAPTPPARLEVSVPVIGEIPVRVELATLSPGHPSATPASGFPPREVVPTLPFPVVTETPPALTPLPTVTLPPLPTTVEPLPTSTPVLETPPLPPLLGTATPTPSPEPTPEPAREATPSPTPTSSPTPTPTSTPLLPTSLPIPTPTPICVVGCS